MVAGWNDARHNIVDIKYLFCELDVFRNTFVNGLLLVALDLEWTYHSQTTKHNCDQTTSTCTTDEVEIVAWKGGSFCTTLTSNLLHDLPQNQKRGESSHSSAIKSQNPWAVRDIPRVTCSVSTKLKRWMDTGYFPCGRWGVDLIFHGKEKIGDVDVEQPGSFFLAWWETKRLRGLANLIFVSRRTERL
jgi:hypothetical protein